MEPDTLYMIKQAVVAASTVAGAAGGLKLLDKADRVQRSKNKQKGKRRKQ